MADRGFTVVVERCGVVTLRDEPLPQPMRDGQFDVETVFSGLSTGTDLSWVKGTNPALHRRWNPELGLFMPGSPDVGYPVDKFGYMQVGRVTESATPAVRPGDVVAMTYGHRSAYRADALTDRFVKLPQSLEPVLGIYAAHMGPICANALLHAAADVHGTDVRGLADGVRGRRIAITGAGVVGLLTALFARLHGAGSVVLVDPTPSRRDVASDLGFEVVDPEDVDPAVVLKSRWRHGTGDRGADVVFQCRGQAKCIGSRPSHRAPPRHDHRPGVLSRWMRGSPTGGGVSPQRTEPALRSDRTGAAWNQPSVGPRTTQHRDFGASGRRR